MRNRRGFIFPLYIVALTLLMCGTVIMLYLNQQDGLNSSLVSPLAVLEVRDDLEIFEMRERELILGSLSEWDKDLFKANFIGGLTEENGLSYFSTQQTSLSSAQQNFQKWQINTKNSKN